MGLASFDVTGCEGLRRIRPVAVRESGRGSCETGYCFRNIGHSELGEGVSVRGDSQYLDIVQLSELVTIGRGHGQ